MNKQEQQNQVSIIINGVRYDAVDVPKEHESRPCAYCDILDFCFESSVDVTCAVLGIINKCFKKSDKKFEQWANPQAALTASLQER